MFVFKPIPEDQLETGYKNLKEGLASFKIVEAQDSDGYGNPLKSKSGSNMLKLTLGISDRQGNRGQLFDYLADGAQWKIHQFLKSIGRLKSYDTGSIVATSLKGLIGQCELKFEDYNGQQKIKVHSYVEREISELSNLVPCNDDDDLPF